MRIDEVVRVQNPMGGDYKSQLDRDRAAAAVRAQRQANREIPNRGAVSGAKSGTDPQGGMFTPGAVTTKSYNNALTKQFARPAGQGKGLDIMGNPLKQPAQRKIEPATQQPQQPTTASTTPNWVGQNTNVPAVQRKQQAQQTQQQSQPPVQQTTQQPTTQPAAQTPATAGTSAPAIASTTVPQQTAPQTTDRPNPYMTPQANTPSEPIKIGGQKLNPKDPTDAKILQQIQKQMSSNVSNSPEVNTKQEPVATKSNPIKSKKARQTNTPYSNAKQLISQLDATGKQNLLNKLTKELNLSEGLFDLFKSKSQNTEPKKTSYPNYINDLIQAAEGFTYVNFTGDNLNVTRGDSIEDKEDALQELKVFKKNVQLHKKEYQLTAQSIRQEFTQKRANQGPVSLGLGPSLFRGTKLGPVARAFSTASRASTRADVTNQLQQLNNILRNYDRVLQAIAEAEIKLKKSILASNNIPKSTSATSVKVEPNLKPVDTPPIKKQPTKKIDTTYTRTISAIDQLDRKNKLRIVDMLKKELAKG